ncbi:MAG: class I SAM-dependent methyltransferase [bacterium]|nr:class I SAM-dependent methyltransferase [bacterium]
MNRFEQINSFVECDFDRKIFLEPENRYPTIKEQLFETIKTYNPGVIVKAGLGNGKLVYETAKEFDFYIVVVESSFQAIKKFIKKYNNDEIVKKIRFINGNFTHFPVDYYAADLLVCIDYFDFIESSQAIDEFRRALNFEAILFLAATVLHDEDLDGIYDDYMRMIFPIHNDYYLKNDLVTFLELNEFKFIKDNLSIFNENLGSKIELLNELYGENSGEKKSSSVQFIEEHREKFNSLYNMNNETITLPYYISTFMRKKLESGEE